ncbi:MAG: MMPL family transporter [Alphaproteobacteria bacterium]|nr:MMPL family transporter [Alphaproteobacteria bacterium]
MLTSFIASIVNVSRRFAGFVVLFFLVASILMAQFAIDHLKINTDIDQLMATNLDWRVREKEIAEAFPQKQDRLVIVVDGVNPDLAERGAANLTEALRKRPELFKSVVRPDSISYFQKYGLLLLSEQEISALLEVLIQSQPLIGSLAKDPSLRGLFSTMNLAILGVKHGETDYKNVEPSFTLMAQTIEANLQGVPMILPWHGMMAGKEPTLRDLRKFIMTQPVLDFSALSPGQKATQAVRDMAVELGLTAEQGVNVRLTGSVALNDEEFASVADGASTATIASIILVILLLYLALRSWRLILPILLTLFVGLITTTSFAMATVGSLNLISVAFAVMFVGIAVDFGIQFGVRFRDEHHKESDMGKAMDATARLIASPITFAAACATLGFMAFIPTNYRGVSELGIIAGSGMVIAYVLNLTLLPALLSLFKPPAEPEAVGYKWTAPLDRALITHRKKLLIIVALVAALSLAIATQARFDFDPLNLKNTKTESVSTLFDIMKDPDATPYTVEILAPSLTAATQLAGQLDRLPEVDHTITLASFVPQNQDQKIALIDDARFLLEPSLYPQDVLTAPTLEETLAALSKTATQLKDLGEDKHAAQRLAKALESVVTRKDPKLLAQLHLNMISGMESFLDKLRLILNGEKASLDSITDDLRKDWITSDGRAKIEVYPKGNARDHHVLAAFTDAVQKMAPEASGTAISIQGSGKTVVNAFIEAGLLALLVISLLGAIVLRRLLDVARLILPLILAGLLTLATMVAINLPLNFANIIALPLLLSLGVTYAIYFISYWKNGKVAPLQSSMTRAVLFSAGTTLVAFGSLSFSSHPGTCGMGQLLTIALIYSLLSTFLVLPLLLEDVHSVKHKT